MMYSSYARRMMTWSLLCLIFSLFNPVTAFASPARHLCRPDQKDALLEFKNDFYVQDTYGRSFARKTTETWRNNTDCCSWSGISCDPKTGNVVDLNLVESSLNGPLSSNSSLFKLQHLQSLNLGFNSFSGILPDSIGDLKYLRVLKLRDCRFFGKVPSSLGNLSYLTHLNLFDNDFTGEIPDSVGSLNQLTNLQIGSNKFSGNFRLMLLNLSKLTELKLGDNHFEGTLPSNMSSLSKLEYFDISENLFSGSIPSSLFMISSLIQLVMKVNHFSGPLEIGNVSSQSHLENLYLGGNNFNGPIPGSISKLVGLLSLDLSFWNTGRGIVDFNIFLHLKSLLELNLAYLNTRTRVDLSIFSDLMSLSSLDLTGNNVIVGSTLHLHSPIEVLKLSGCSIIDFPKFLQSLTNLSWLDISANQIEGKVPEWLWKLPRLQVVNISQNSFTGFEGPADVIQRSEVYVLDTSSNSFHYLPLLPNFTLLFSGSDNLFSGEIPRTLCNLVALRTLLLANNKFSGSIPRCFENCNLFILHLQNNSLSGVFPVEAISTRLISLDLGHNRLSRKLPKSLINCTQLEFLNVEDNKINDTFPSWLRFLPNLQILVIRSNEFHGPISSSRASLSFPKLRIFDISENHFTGVLPSDYFARWSAMSSMVDIVDRPATLFIRTSQSYHMSVGFTNKGSYMKILGSGFTMYKTIDVSGNKLEGNIPESIALLKELIVLNMSNNAFTGRIPPSLSNLTNLQSLDLSHNRLSSRIPPDLGKLTFLAWMNFSYNKLEGPIPQGTQIQSQNSSAFAENPGLCGVPLEQKCGEQEQTGVEKEEEEEEQVVSWIAAAIAYVPGVFCGLTIGHILFSYKHVWFMKIFHSCT